MSHDYLIYKFTSPSGRAYIGQTKDLSRRITQHKGTASCRAFNNAIKKHGFENFTREILKENLTVDEANHWEELYIKEHRTLSPNGYNLATGGSNSIPSEETRAKLSAAQKRRPPMSEETKMKIMAAKIGVKRSEEARKSMSKAQIGKKASPETRAKMSLAQQNLSPEIREKRREAAKSRVISEETRAKLSVASRSRSPESRAKLSAALKLRPPISEETRAKLSASNTGKKHTEEARKKMSESKKGKKQSAEVIAKRSAAMIGRKHSPETIAKLSFANSNRSEETRAKLAESTRQWHARKREEKEKMQLSIF
jgi:group I intron endonuclease